MAFLASSVAIGKKSTPTPVARSTTNPVSLFALSQNVSRICPGDAIVAVSGPGASSGLTAATFDQPEVAVTVGNPATVLPTVFVAATL